MKQTGETDVNKIKEAMEAFDNAPSDGTPVPAPAAAPEPTPTPEPPADVEPEPVPEPELEPSSVAEPEPLELPDDLRRSAAHQGWNEEAVDAALKANPDAAMRMFEKLHESNNTMSNQFATMGRKMVEIADKEAALKAAPKPTQEPSIDLSSIKQNDPDNALLPIVEQLVKKLDSQASAPAPSVPVQPTNTGNVGRETQALIGRQIYGFFVADDMKPYRDLYGDLSDEKTPLLPGQRANYNEVCILANDIRIGAYVNGVDMPVEVAMEKAHLVVSAPYRKQKDRDELKANGKKQQSGLQIKPSSQSVAPKPLTEAEQKEAKLLASAAAGLKVFKNA